MTAHGISISAIRQAIETRDGDALAAFYADDALLRVIDRDHPPSRPRDIEGRAAIAAYLHDICGRDMTHRLENGVADGERMAFTQSCTYPDGARVFASAMLELRDGRIVRETLIQAWDA